MTIQTGNATMEELNSLPKSHASVTVLPGTRIFMAAGSSLEYDYENDPAP